MSRRNAPLGRVAEGDRDAVGAGARGAADAVDIALRHVGQLEIDDMGDAVDVDAARRDVGRDQHADAAGAEIAERALARDLRFVAVDRLGADAVARQMLRDAVGAVLGAGEDQARG